MDTAELDVSAAPAWPAGSGEMAGRIRTFDWSQTPLGAIETWTERCRGVVDMVLASGFPTVALVGPELIQVYNDGYRALMGEKHPTGLGQPSLDCWPEAAAIDGPIYERVFAGETVTLHDSHRRLLRNGTVEDAWFTLSYSPLRGPDGAVADVLVIVFETTDRVRARNDLQRSEARLAAVLDGLPVGVGVTNADGEFLLINEAMRRFVPTGLMPSRDETRRSRWRAVDREGRSLEPRDFPGARALRGERVVPGVTMLHTGDDGHTVWTSVAAVPILDAAGRIGGHTAVVHDIDAVKRAEERQAFLLALADALRPATSAVEIQATVARLLGEHLRGDRTYYSEIDSADGRVVVRREYNPRGAPSLVREHTSAFSKPVFDVLREGRPFVSDDVGTDPRFAGVLSAYQALSIGSVVRTPLIRNGRLVASLGISNVATRTWTEAEVALVAEVAERTWDAIERARVESRLRASEERYRAFVTASSDVVYRMGPDWAELRELDGRGFLSDTEEPSSNWLDRYIHPDDQPGLRVAIARAIGTKSTFALEHRVIRADGSFGWAASRAVPVLDESGEIVEWLGAASDVTAREEARQREQAGRERQAFLLKLSDALRPLSDAAAVQGEACRLLTEHLGADRAYYVEVDEAAGIARVQRDHVRNGAPSLAGEHPVSSFAWSVDILRRGGCHVIPDTQSSPLVPDADRAACARLGIVACMGTPLLKAGQLVGALCVTVADVRDWRSEDVDLLRDVGERIWATVERAQAEARLRASEALFRSFAENSTDTLWIADAASGRLDYLSPAFAAMFGADPDGVRADIGRFLDLVHPDDRVLVAEAMPTLLSSGETYQIEYRIVRPGDGAVRWLQDTGFPIRDASGVIERAGGVVQDVTDRREAEETLRGSEKQLQVMVAELHHRTRNLIGVVGTLMRQVLASSASLADFRVRFTERLEALSRVQGLFSAKADERIDVGDIVRLELDALGADLGSHRIAIEGEALALRKSAVQTLALAIHELATNALKYGALRSEAGQLVVRWQEYVSEAGVRRLGFEWTETDIDTGIEPTDGSLHHGGYGRELIERALPYTLKAKTSYNLGRDRLDCTIDMPLQR